MTSGRQRVGRQRVGRQRVGRQGAGRQRVGRQRVGRQRVGRQRVGRQRVGRQRVGRQRVGRQRVGRQGAVPGSIIVTYKLCINWSRSTEQQAVLTLSFDYYGLNKYYKNSIKILPWALPSICLSIISTVHMNARPSPSVLACCR